MNRILKVYKIAYSSYGIEPTKQIQKIRIYANCLNTDYLRHHQSRTDLLNVPKPTNGFGHQRELQTISHGLPSYNFCLGPICNGSPSDIVGKLLLVHESVRWFGHTR